MWKKWQGIHREIGSSMRYLFVASKSWSLLCLAASPPVLREGNHLPLRIYCKFRKNNFISGKTNVSQYCCIWQSWLITLNSVTHLGTALFRVFPTRLKCAKTNAERSPADLLVIINAPTRRVPAVDEYNILWKSNFRDRYKTSPSVIICSRKMIINLCPFVLSTKQR